MCFRSWVYVQELGVCSGAGCVCFRSWVCVFQELGVLDESRGGLGTRVGQTAAQVDRLRQELPREGRAGHQGEGEWDASNQTDGHVVKRGAHSACFDADLTLNDVPKGFLSKQRGNNQGPNPNKAKGKKVSIHPNGTFTF